MPRIALSKAGGVPIDAPSIRVPPDDPADTPPLDTPRRSRPQLTVVAAALNEMGQAGQWLEGVRFADRIVVVDHGSEDGTREFFRAQGEWVRLIECEPGGIVEDVRMRGLEWIDDGWILVLDLDERVPIPLRDEILATLDRAPPEAAFRIPFRHYVFGRWLRHGGWDDAHLRLFRAGAGQYAPGRIHAQPQVEGEIGRLEERIVHFAHPTLHDFIAKMNRYTSQSAATLAAGAVGGLRRRTALPPRPVSWLSASASVFWNRYVRAGGFRDGMAGFLIASMLATYQFVEQAKAWEEQEGATA